MWFILFPILEALFDAAKPILLIVGVVVLCELVGIPVVGMGIDAMQEVLVSA